MPSVANKPIILSVIMLNVVAPSNQFIDVLLPSLLKPTCDGRYNNWLHYYHLWVDFLTALWYNST